MDCASCNNWSGSECSMGLTNVFGCRWWEPKYAIIDISAGESLDSSTSKGNQPKWYLPSDRLFVKAPFVYDGVQFSDYLCEKVASSIGRQLGFPVIDAEVCRIKDGENIIPGSVTCNFLSEGEVHITFYRLLMKFELTSFFRKFDSGVSTEEKLKMVIDVLSKFCGIDASEYLFQMIALDLLIGNEDRHLNNFGVIYSHDTNKFKMAPIFDSGLSLFEHDTKYIGRPLHICMRNMKAKPFSTDFWKAFKAAQSISSAELKGSIKLGGLVFPSQKALGYLRFQAEKLGLELDEDGVSFEKR